MDVVRGGDAMRMKMETGGDEDRDGDEDVDLDEVLMGMGKEMKRGIRMAMEAETDGDRVTDVDEDRDGGGGDCGEVLGAGPSRAWVALAGEVLAKFGMCDWGGLEGDWSGLGCQVEGLQQGWGCWVWGVTVGFGVSGWRGSQQDLECWAGIVLVGFWVCWWGCVLKLQPQISFFASLLPPTSTASSPQGRFRFLFLFNTLEAIFRKHWGSTMEFPSLILQGRSLCLVTKPEKLQILSCHMTE